MARLKANSIIVCFSLLVLTAAINSDINADETSFNSDFNYDFREFIHWVRTEADQKGVPGAALAIVSREGIMYLQTWGKKDLNEEYPVTSDSVFRIASMSKTFAGTALAIMIDNNPHSWDTKVSDLFPQIRIGNKSTSEEITLKHLVSHSTGLMPHSYSNMLDDGVAYERIKEKFHQIPTVCSPGECYGYQNVVFSLIADVIEKTISASYEGYLEEEIFKPLGMVSTSIGMDPYLNDHNSVSPHRLVRGSWRTTTTNPAYYSVAPASGINASIFDMTMWVRANLGAFPEVLPIEFLNSIHEPVVSTPYGSYFNRWDGLQKAYYAIGWRVFDYKDIRAIHHGGGVRGFRSEMVFVPGANIGMVLLFNAESNLANDVVPVFLDNLIR